MFIRNYVMAVMVPMNLVVGVVVMTAVVADV